MHENMPSNHTEQIGPARALCEEYARWLGIDLCFQGFAAELASLPGVYAPPRGRLLLALAGSEVAGCVAFAIFGGWCWRDEAAICTPGVRGQRLGRGLAERAIQEHGSSVTRL
jgi:putative acetyltransferase